MTLIARWVWIGVLVALVGGCGSATEGPESVAESEAEIAAVATRYLELDGVIVGTVSDVTEITVVAPVVPLGPDLPNKKQPVKKSAAPLDVAFTVTAQSNAMLQWIQASLALQPVRKSLALLTPDSNYNEVSRLEFSDAAIVHVDFPELDASSTAVLKIGVKLHALASARVAGSGQRINGPIGAKVHQWTAQQYRLDIAGIASDVLLRVSRVAPFSIRMPDSGKVGVAPTQTVDNLIITLPEHFARSLRAWADSDRVSGVKSTRAGVLQYLTAQARPDSSLDLRGLTPLQFSTVAATQITTVTLAIGGVEARF